MARKQERYRKAIQRRRTSDEALLDAVQLAVARDLQQSGLVSVMVAADRKLCRVAEACSCSTINPGDPDVVVP